MADLRKRHPNHAHRGLHQAPLVALLTMPNGLREPLAADTADVPLEVSQIRPAALTVELLQEHSVCGCAAGKARPGVRLALEHSIRPDRLATVFAGMEIDATERARGHFIGYPPSSPQIALFRDGQLVHMLERQDIQGRSAEAIAGELRSAFDKYCAPAGSGERQRGAQR